MALGMKCAFRGSHISLHSSDLVIPVGTAATEYRRKWNIVLYFVELTDSLTKLVLSVRLYSACVAVCCCLWSSIIASVKHFNKLLLPPPIKWMLCDRSVILSFLCHSVNRITWKSGFLTNAGTDVDQSWQAWWLCRSYWLLVVIRICVWIPGHFLSRVIILTRDIDIANLSGCPSVCLSVRPSVTFRYQMKMA